MDSDQFIVSSDPKPNEVAMTRYCLTCSRIDRERVERRILDGESMRSVASTVGISYAAVTRHMRNHADPDAIAALPEAQRQTPEDLAQTLFDIADQAASIGERSSDARIKLLALREQRLTVESVITRLGIDDREITETVAEARSLMKNVYAVLRHRPEVATVLADRLSADGQGDLAKVFATLADSTAANPLREELTA